MQITFPYRFLFAKMCGDVCVSLAVFTLLGGGGGGHHQFVDLQKLKQRWHSVCGSLCVGVFPAVSNGMELRQAGFLLDHHNSNESIVYQAQFAFVKAGFPRRWEVPEFLMFM